MKGVAYVGISGMIVFTHKPDDGQILKLDEPTLPTRVLPKDCLCLNRLLLYSFLVESTQPRFFVSTFFATLSNVCYCGL